MKRLLAVLVLTFISFGSFASHMMGGEITWRCSGNNYVFYLKVYRDCRGVGFTNTTQQITVTGHPTISSINCAPYTLTDLSAPNCGYSCADANPPQGATEEYVFKSAPISLGNFTPPAAGWIFTWNLCCRNGTILNLTGPGGLGMTLRSKMFSFNGQLATPCFDNSPAFAERPSSFICSGYSFTYNHTAIDVEFDSLVYTWDRPADGNAPALTLLNYANGYTINNQMPGTPTLDVNTGEVNIFPDTNNLSQGDFVTCVRVDAYKCNIKVAEIYREIQVGLSNACGTIFGGTLDNPPKFLDPNTNLPYLSITDTIIAGDSAFFAIKIQDTDFNTVPVFGLQTVTLEVVGQALDSAYFAAPGSGCGRPPCATLNKVTPYTFSPADIIRMNWKTNCNHLPRKQGCVSLSNKYTFVLKARDNFCPAPARKNVTVNIIVVEPPRLLPPTLRCASVDTLGHVTLTWTPPTPKDTFNVFYNYQILRATNPAGPFVTIDSVLSYFSGSYTDVTINAQQQKYYYYMQTRCGCDSLKLSDYTSDTLETMMVTGSFLTPGSPVATVTWNPISTPLPASNFNGYYYIYRTNHAFNTTVFVDSTNSVLYLDTLLGCIDSITWRVGILDSSGCTSWSAFGGTSFTNDTVVEPPTINCVSVLANGNVTLDWSPPAPADSGRIFGGYMIYRSTPSPAGPYSLIGSVNNYNTKTYTDASANVYSGGPYYYYITTLDSCGMIESDSAGRVTPIILNADTTGGNGNVLLSWNNIYFPSQPANYEVWKKIGNAASFNFLTNVNNAITYSDPITLCKDSVTYQIRLVHAGPDACTSYSSIDGDSVLIPTPVIGAVEPRCSAVAPNGDVTIWWQTPTDTASYFKEYQVYQSTNPAGPFNTLIGTINNYSTNSFTDVGTTANTQINYYTVVTRAGCDALTLFNSIQSDTIATIKLNVSNVALGLAQLSWNAPHTPPAQGANSKYVIKRRYTGVGLYAVIDSTASLNYIDFIDSCSVPYEYLVELENTLTCTSVSSAANDVFTYSGNIVSEPSLRCVSVNPNGSIVLTWDTTGMNFQHFTEYEIYRNGVYLDSVTSSSILSYTDLTANGNSASYSYYMLSHSGCTGNVSSANSATVNSIYLLADSNNTSLNPGLADLNWTPLPLVTTSSNYNIFSDYNDPLQNGPDSIGNTAALNYAENVLNCDTGITHYVQVNDNSGCYSRSNVVNGVYSYAGNVIPAPSLRCVSVLPNGQIELSWSTSGITNFTDFNSYEIYRNGAALATINNSATVNYIDATANGNTSSFSYYLFTKSGCSGNVNSANSATVNSIYLLADSNNTSLNPGLADLSWNALPLVTTSSNYNIYSDYNDPLQNGPDSIGNTAALNYAENVVHCDTGITHYVQVNDNSGCYSRSNVVNGVYSYEGNVIPAPSLRCVSVLPNGQIELSWSTSGITNFTDFNSYEIYRNGAALTTINNSATVNYIDATANGNTSSFSYYIFTKSGCSGNVNSANSATVNSIYLLADSNNTTLNPGLADLSWNALPLVTTSSNYNIYSDYNDPLQNGPDSIGNTAALNYAENVIHCDTGITHYVQVNDNSGCYSRSNVVNGVYSYEGNVIPAPSLRCVSVLPNGQIELSWSTSGITNFTDFNSYEIYRNGAALTTINNSATVNYIDATANGNTSSFSYYIFTKSGCSGNVNSANSATVNSIYLLADSNNTTLNPGLADLSWNALPLVTTSSNYNIYSDYNDPLQNGPDSIGNTAALNYAENVIHCDTGITHFVQVNDNSGCYSRSNVVNGVYSYEGNVIPAPQLRCVSVTQPAGAIELTWITSNITDFTNFNSYEIYRDNVLVGSTNNQIDVSFTDAGINGNTAPHNYFLLTRAGCSGLVPSVANSDTLSSIKLNVGNTNSTIANLQWNLMHNPAISGASNTFRIYKEYPANVWTQLPGIITTTEFHDTITICGDNINYYVEQYDAVGNCFSKSSIDGDYFRDIISPADPLIESVSVNPNDDQTVTIQWLPSSSGDVIYYKIYVKNAFGAWDSVGTVSNNFLSYSTINPAVDNGPQFYSVIAEDSCGNKSVVGIYPHRTIFSTAEMDICRAAIDVRWSPYLNMPDGVKQYDIYVSQDGNPAVLAGSVNSNLILYSDTNLVAGSIYCYYINAVGNTLGREATSNASCDTAELLTLPQFSYLNKASVVDVRRVIIELLVDTVDDPDISKFKVQRSINRTGPFYTIGYVNYVGSPRISYLDNTAQTDDNSYFYRVITVDSCGNDVLTSNIGRTILLSGIPNYNLTNKIKWNDYEEWLGGISGFSIFRRVDGVLDNLPVATPLFGINDYLDNVGEIYQTTGRFCYRIAAYEGAGNTYGFSDTSYSNEFCMVQEPHLFVPSAFTPEGSNPVFKPEFIYTDAKNYKFSVFNRWGEKVFETEDPVLGWNGTIEGSNAPQGTYVYYVRLFGTNGQELNKSGRVTLLR
jgi:gliding motility-associated-like protein